MFTVLRVTTSHEVTKVMATVTTEQKRRGPEAQLSEREAWDMWQAGFRFSIFDPTTDTYVLTEPAEVRRQPAREAVTSDY